MKGGRAGSLPSEGQKKTENEKLGLPVLFYNDRFVLVFSILTVVVPWFIMVTVNTQE